MKLKGRELPFWVVKKSGRRYQCFRFFRISSGSIPELDKYYYNAEVAIRVLDLPGKPMWRSDSWRPSKPTGLWLSRSSVQNYSELSILPSKGKRQFIVELFKL